MKRIILILLMLLPVLGTAQIPDGAEILKKIDENTIAENRSSTLTMIVHGRRGDRTMTLKSWIEGSEKSFSEYLAPAREKGTKMLKLGDQLWLYSPQSDRIIRIAGHMLRQSMMGSDFSYEDMMEDRTLSDTYNAKVLGSESFLDRDCWVLELTAIVDDVAYHSRKIWVDKKRMVVLKDNSIEFDVEIPKHIFSKAALKK
ncbi:hypothetical protein B6I21_03160 [candidate division KSB1 bacterium 4572_119]|nr:MAG: hypothetical protein B6I21_03160 [candidate division KSB1 bacterium 4572_119]